MRALGRHLGDTSEGSVRGAVYVYSGPRDVRFEWISWRPKSTKGEVRG